MNGKNNGHEGAPPQRASHLMQDLEEEDRGGSMNQDAGEMMAAWIQAIQLAVQHMGKPRDGVPVGRMDVRECPPDSLDRQASGDLRVLKDIDVVIQIDELKTKRLAKDEPGDRSNETANTESHPAIARVHGV